MRTHDIDQEDKPFFGMIYRGVSRRTRCLSREEEARLVLAYQEHHDRDAARILVESFLPWIVSQTATALRRFKRTLESQDDATAYGVVGFLEGASRWNPSHEARLSSFVAPYVVSAVTNADRHVLCMGHSKGHAWRKAAWREAWILQGEHPANPEGRAHCAHIADHFSLDTSVVENVATFLALEPDTRTLERTAQPTPTQAPAPVFAAAQSALVAALRTVVAKATPRQREAWAYILVRQVSDEKVSCESIGELMGVTKVRVRQLENDLLSKLRAQLLAQGISHAHEALDTAFDAHDLPIGLAA